MDPGTLGFFGVIGQFWNFDQRHKQKLFFGLSSVQRSTTGGKTMEFKNGLGDTAIQDVMVNYPEIGEILNRYEIGCVTCKVGICLLKDVVSIHGLSKENEAAIEQEINDHLDRHHA
jgi:hypothetical protein